MASTREICFSFDERRTVQACAVLFPQSRRENYTKLLKLLYLADRRSLIETGAPITGAHVVSMKNGPVLTEVYDCIKGEPSESVWDAHIERVGAFDVVLKKHPGDSELSDYDVQVLQDIAKRHCDDNFGNMIDIVHQLPEWSNPEKLNRKTLPIPVSEILRAAGKDEETIAKVADDTNYHAAVDRLLRRRA
jgi:uncharacterized phage-associated protein